ncbi:ABC transporter permease/M1 family aminopeptidase [Caulobacter sp. KR2-114]|uniref:ABC transporter permease/M1 family aminopeptidase n=1 Tax=Caulobacter sp. KR2-114 TaxID=3400912 RepID=UPI003C0FCE37
MLLQVAGFEVRYQLRQPLFWIVTAILAVLALIITGVGSLSLGSASGVHRNSPDLVNVLHLVFSIFFMFGGTAFVAGSVLKDDDTGFAPILRTTQLSKFDYLYGRFAGAFAVICLCFLGVTVASLLGGMAPWLDPDLKGAFLPGAYAYAYLVLALPNVFFTSAAFFALSTVTRSMGWTFVGVIGFLVIYVITNLALSRPDLAPVVAHWEPFGSAAYEYTTRYWTVAERNSLDPPVGGILLFNRLFVLLLGAVFLAAAYPLSRLQTQGIKATARRRPAAAALEAPSRRGAIRPRTAPAGGAGWAQMAARTRFDMAHVFKSAAFWAILALGTGNALAILWQITSDDRYGGALWPVTRILIPGLEGGFTIFPMIIAGYFAGDLIWRDRERRMHEIIDATPAPDWTFVLPKVAAVALVLWATLAVSVLAAIGIQLSKGYTDLEPGKYLLWYLAPQAVNFAALAVLAVFFQVLSPNKFVGWGLMLVWFVGVLTLPRVGWEHGLLFFGSPFQSRLPLSDMNGLGHFWIGPAWFGLYDLGLGALLVALCYGLWRRGAETRYRPRFARFPGRLRGPAGIVAGAGAVVAVGAGAFILVNTNVWNEYRTRESNQAWQADYERALLRYERVPQPSVTAVTLSVSLHPHQPMMEAKGVYVLQNLTSQPLREVHVRFDREVTVCALNIAGAWAKTAADPRFNYRIFTFDSPMLPGEKRTLSFTTELTQHGFRNRDNLTSVVDNGTFVNSAQIAPVIGMSRDELLRDHAARWRHGLKYDLHPPPLSADPAARQYSYVGHASWTTADITVTTDADQTPIAPGYKVSDVTAGGRRTARFVTEAPILQFFSIQSARYLSHVERYKGVDLTVFYDPHHPYNVARMETALKASLDYYQANFSPYQFRQARITEFPDYAEFAQSFAGTFPWSEGLGFIADYRDPEKIDLVTYVAAHEFAHQWWAHQIVGADMQGATSLSETLAQYSALRVMRDLYGPDHIRKFLKFELDSYLRARGSATVDEQDLEHVESDQGYIHYRKGSLVMYRLADEIGEDKVNAALRSLLQKYAFKGAPYPTSLDLVAALRAQAPADKQQLITDLFEKITLYDVKTTAAKTARLPDGRWRVTLTVTARKLYADGKGKETPAPMNEALWVGLFDAKPGAGAFGARNVIALERRPIHDGTQTISFDVSRPPTWAGADPYNELIDRDSDDNLIAVK